MRIREFIPFYLYFFLIAPVPAQFHEQTKKQEPWMPGTAVTAPFAEIPAVSKQQIQAAYVQLPLRFEANQGQTDGRVKFLSRADGYTLFLTSTEAVFQFRNADRGLQIERRLRNAECGLRNKESAIGFRESGTQECNNLPSATHSEYSPTRNQRNPQSAIHNRQSKQSAVLHVALVGADPAAEVAGLDELPGKSNYFIGKDPRKWRINVPHYAKVRYRNVYPGIDLVYYGKQRQLEYDLVVAPGANPESRSYWTFLELINFNLTRKATWCCKSPAGKFDSTSPLSIRKCSA